MNRKKYIQKIIKESIQVKDNLLRDKDIISEIERTIDTIITALQDKKKIVAFGNGGSAADTQHFVAELINRFKKDRKPLPAVSLTTDTSVLTSIANDAGYDYVFSKQIEALGKRGDIAIAITTSDIKTKKGSHSVNIGKALLSAKKRGMVTIGLVSEKSKKILRLLDIAIKVPSRNTPRIQEAHITILHIICELVEKILFEKEYEKSN